MVKNEKNTDAEKVKIKLFSDRPLTADKEQEVRFGHLDIVANLQNILLNCPVPFTIGLFGKWGSGKTTILNVLEGKLKRQKIAVVNFDVWKHEGDALRRTFLKESTQQLKEYLPKDFELNERLEIPIRKTVENKIQWNKKFVFILCILVGALVGGVVIVYHLFPENLGIYSSVVLGGGLISAILLWVVQHLLVTETLTKIFDRFKDPHEFEAEFKRIVRKIGCERLLFIIDNLDRCTHKRAVELLSTIKTFLAKDRETSEENKCIFLITCDDEAIKGHLASVYKLRNKQDQEKSFNPDEFLRKFFNTSLRIPQFIDTELQTYTENLLKETRITELNSLDVASVITTAFRDNPRQIKQFINVLIANFLLVKEREEKEILPKGVITDNVAFLTKFLVIQQEYPEAYREIQGKMLSVQEWDTIKKDNVHDFLRATKPVVATDIRPFIFLKQSEEERALPQIRELERALLDNNYEKVKEMLWKIKESTEKVDNLGKCVVSLIRRNTPRKIPLLNIINSSLGALKLHNLELRSDFYNLIGDLLNDEEILKPQLPQIEPSVVFEQVLTRCRKQDKNGIITYYINTLDKQEEEKKIPIEKVYSILRELRKHKDWLSKKERERIKTILTSRYSSSLQILSLFKSVEDQKDFVSEETISKFISALSDGDLENQQSLNDKVEQLFAFGGIFTAKLIQDLIKRISELLETENSKPFRPQKENFLASIEKILTTFYKEIENVPNDNLNPFAEKVTQGINAISDIPQKKIFVLSCLKIYSLLRDEAKKTEVNNAIATFMQSADVDNLKFVFDKLSEEEKEEIIKRYVDIFNQRIVPHQPVLVYLYPIAPQEIKTQWLIHLINSAPGRAIQKLRDLNYKVDDRRKVAQALLAKVQEIPFQEKGAFYEAVNKMKCANDAELRNILGSQIKPLLSSSDQNLQKVGYDVLQGATHLSERVKREITREIVEWLRSLEPANANQPHSIRSITLNWDILESPVQGDYIDFVSNKLILRASDINNIRLGFEMLSMTKVKYEDYNTYFDDIFARAEGEGDSQIKTELKNGLLKLKPSVLNKKNREFWRKIEKL